jgi:hypothetical protein
LPCPFLLELVAQVFGQAVEALLPEGAVLCDPVGGGRERSGIETAVVDAPLATALQESGVLENLEVLRDGGKRNVEGFREVRDAGLPERQAREDGAPRRVRQRGERPVEGA